MGRCSLDRPSGRWWRRERLRELVCRGPLGLGRRISALPPFLSRFRFPRLLVPLALVPRLGRYGERDRDHPGEVLPPQRDTD